MAQVDSRYLPMPPFYLSICAIFRNERPYLAEWITFHHMMGVEHFHLYDNASEDDPVSVLQPFVEAGLVTLRHWPEPFHLRAQRNAYQHCLEVARHQTRWLAFIDLDEFLFAPLDHHLGRTLRDYERWPGMVVHWQNYGSGGQRLRGAAPVIERFTRRAHRNWVRNRKVKSIVDPARTEAPLGVHHFAYADGALAVDETGRAVRVRPRPRYKKKLKPWYGRLGPLLRFTDPYCAAAIDNRQVCVARLRINHYPVKSLEEFRAKATLKREKRRYEDVDYFAYHDRNEVHDPVLCRYLPELRDRMSKITHRTADTEATLWNCPS